MWKCLVFSSPFSSSLSITWRKASRWHQEFLTDWSLEFKYYSICLKGGIQPCLGFLDRGIRREPEGFCPDFPDLTPNSSSPPRSRSTTVICCNTPVVLLPPFSSLRSTMPAHTGGQLSSCHHHALLGSNNKKATLCSTVAGWWHEPALQCTPHSLRSLLSQLSFTLYKSLPQKSFAPPRQQKAG